MANHQSTSTVVCPPEELNCTAVFKDHLSASRNYRVHRGSVHGPAELPIHPDTWHPTPPFVDVPDHAHYIIGSAVLIVGITGLLGNALVIYTFCRSRALRTSANMFVVNLAVADFLMSLTQSPVFFAASVHRRWVFGERACELYAFCGALFGMCSMMTLTAIAVDRCVAITRPLASLGGRNRQRAAVMLTACWLWSLGWSLPPFFGWSAYVPEGLQTSCSWDYTTFTPSVRAYTLLLFTFVFFIPLGVIGGCYLAIFRAVRRAGHDVCRLDCGEEHRTYERLRGEWRMAKAALVVILLFVVSWSPYAVVALVATAGYAHLITPYVNSVPAVIAKASAIHNPIIYAVTHPKYRAAIARYVPVLRCLLRVADKDLHSSFSSDSGTPFDSRRPTCIGQCSQGTGVVSGAGLSVGARANERWGQTCLSSVSDTDSYWTESETDGSGVNSVHLGQHFSVEISKDTGMPNEQSGGVFSGQKKEVLSDNLRAGYGSTSGSLNMFEGHVLDAGLQSDVTELLLLSN
ncbi:melanopsin-like [Esox lucius]|uniref:G-protein coupled receptors family 1 profile domain-containing protein n=1 Tax=Esox lucius TaxID=8010 RepID=A0A3P8YPZ3_ESOLU|nr:melanopsin-like [Esox lucius]